MLRGEFAAAGELSPGELRREYDEVLAATVDRVGRQTVAGGADVSESTLEALGDGERPDLSLAEAAAILATDAGRPDAGTLEAEARDLLLMGMSGAVLDVEALASAIDDRLEPKEIQQKVEGRYPMSLDEYALLHSTIEGKKR